MTDSGGNILYVGAVVKIKHSEDMKFDRIGIVRELNPKLPDPVIVEVDNTIIHKCASNTILMNDSEAMLWKLENL